MCNSVLNAKSAMKAKATNIFTASNAKNALKETWKTHFIVTFVVSAESENKKIASIVRNAINVNLKRKLSIAIYANLAFLFKP